MNFCAVSYSHRDGAQMISALYVDDEPGLLKITKLFLKKERDIQVDTAQSASEALEKLIGGQYDIVISDYEMPGLNGLQLLKSIRSEGKNIPFIIFTGRGREDVVIEAFNEGADFYLQKGGQPKAQFAELVHKIRRAVGSRKAQQALLESEERFRSFVENANAFVYSITSDGILTYVSPNFEELLGLTSGRLLGKSFDSLIHPDDAHIWREFLRGAVSNSERQSVIEYRILDHEGRWRWHSSSAALLKSSGQEGEGEKSVSQASYVGIAQDITERRREQEALARAESLARASEERRILLDSIQTQVWYLTDDHTYGAVNEAHAAFLGKSKEEIAFKDMYEIFPKDVVELCRIGNIEVFSTGLPISSEEWVPNASGQRRLLSIRKYPRLHADGAVEYVVCSAEDTTERKLAEEALLESEENFRAFFESMTDPILVANPGGRILYSNAAVGRLLGYSREALSRMHILDLHPPGLRAEAGAIFSEMLLGRRSTCPLSLSTKDGDTVPVETRVWAGRWNGEDCIFGVCKDLSVEEEARQMFERLFSHNPTPLALTKHPDRRLCNINDAFTEAIGYTRDEVIGRTAKEIGLFVDPERQAEVAGELSEKKRVSGVELLIRRKGGTTLTGLFSGEMITSQGQQYFLTAMIDITERKRMEHELEMQSQLQWLLMDIANACINLPLGEVEAKVREALGRLGEFVRADRVYVFDYDFNRQICRNSSEWCGMGIAPQIDLLQEVALDSIPEWVSTHSKGEAIYIPDVQALPPGGVRDTLEPQDIKSLLSVPMMSRGQCIGFVGFDSVREHHEYTEAERKILCFFTEMLVNIHERKLDEGQRTECVP